LSKHRDNAHCGQNAQSLDRANQPGSRFRICRVPFDRDPIEARLALDLIASADVPQIALDALEAGLDGPATRRLVVLERPTYFEVAEVLPRVRQELGLAQITIGQASVRVARQMARDVLLGGDDPLRQVCTFEFLWVVAHKPKAFTCSSVS
jgi:hypothetical protein